jgi:hypothetical protein
LRWVSRPGPTIPHRRPAVVVASPQIRAPLGGILAYPLAGVVAGAGARRAQPSRRLHAGHPQLAIRSWHRGGAAVDDTADKGPGQRGYGGRDRARTCDLVVVSDALWPAELHALVAFPQLRGHCWRLGNENATRSRAYPCAPALSNRPQLIRSSPTRVHAIPLRSRSTPFIWSGLIVPVVRSRRQPSGVDQPHTVRVHELAGGPAPTWRRTSRGWPVAIGPRPHHVRTS